MQVVAVVGRAEGPAGAMAAAVVSGILVQQDSRRSGRSNQPVGAGCRCQRGFQIKWFKHLVASTSDPDIMESEVHFGTAGPYVFWRVLEILAREDATAAALHINRRVLMRFFPAMKPGRVAIILGWFSERSRIILKTNGEDISLFCPKLGDISAPYAKKVQTELKQKSKSVATKEVDLEVDLEVEKEKDKTTPPPSPPEKQDPVQDILGTLTSPLSEAVTEWIAHRRHIKKPIKTPRALNKALNKARAWLPDNIEKQAELFDNAVMNGWQSIYWPKEWGACPVDERLEPKISEAWR